VPQPTALLFVPFIIIIIYRGANSDADKGIWLLLYSHRENIANGKLFIATSSTVSL
jgi:SNF family Na+-dependent transporter